MRPAARACPLCGDTLTAGPAFPYATRFDERVFSYLRCASCRSVFVDPVPEAGTFTRMYTKAAYHDRFYEGLCDDARYRAAAEWLRGPLPPGARVLDYGCGLGGFLQAVAAAGWLPVGVEFDREAARRAQASVGCPVMTVEEFWGAADASRWDAIHLGDVLEHLPDPAATLGDLLERLRPGGLLFVEGPLEINPSLVYGAARLYGAIKRRLRPGALGNSPPTHLFRTAAGPQLAFFRRVAPRLELLDWQVYETGWPYADGGALKRAIAGLARVLGGRTVFGVTFGNRFCGLWRAPAAAADGSPHRATGSMTASLADR